MRPAYDVTSIYAAEAAMMKQIPADDLMARAARGLARVILDVPQPARIAGARVVLLIGSGNNGGDALFAGAALARRGARVDAITLGAEFHERGGRALRAAGGHIRDHTSPAAPDLVAAADIVVDGIVGIGAQGALRADAAQLVAAIPPTAWVVAVDIPSGVDPNTGVVADPNAVVTADITVTFGALKAGQLLPPGRERCGILELVDIGLTPYAAAQEPLFTVLSLADAAPYFAPPASPTTSTVTAFRGFGLVPSCIRGQRTWWWARRATAPWAWFGFGRTLPLRSRLRWSRDTPTSSSPEDRSGMIPRPLPGSRAPASARARMKSEDSLRCSRRTSRRSSMPTP